MPQNVTPHRIRVPADKQDVFDSLCSSEDAVFEMKAQLMLLAASIGFNEQKRCPFEKSDEPIRFGVYENLPHFWAVFGLLAITEAKETSALSESQFDERVMVFEEYANGGLEILRSRVTTPPGGNLDLLITMLSAKRPREADGDTNLISDFDLSLD